MPIEVCLADYENPQHQRHLRELMTIYALDPMGGGKPLPDDVLEKLPWALAECGNAFTLIAYKKNQAIGLLTGFQSLSSFKAKPLINIHDVIVHPDFRHQGIGNRLLNCAEDYARQRDCCKLTLEVLSGNTSAQQLYRRSGFEDYALDPAAGTALFWQKEL